MNIIKNRVNDVTVLDIQGVIKLGESAREFSIVRSNDQRPTNSGQRSTDNGQRSTDNDQRSTDNDQRTTINGQRSTSRSPLAASRSPAEILMLVSARPHESLVTSRSHHAADRGRGRLGDARAGLVRRPAPAQSVQAGPVRERRAAAR